MDTLPAPSTVLDPNICVASGELNCTVAGQLLASIYNFGSTRVPYRHVWDFFRESYCLETGDNIGSVLFLYDEWTERARADKSLLTMFRDNVTEEFRCYDSFCRALEFSGNADFAGIGVMVSFCIQISIATCFAAFCLFCIYKETIRNQREVVKDWKYFRETFHAFFISSVYINIAIGLAAVITIALENKTQYTAIFCTLGLLLSISSTQALWCLHRLYIDSEYGPDIPFRTKVNTLLIQICLGLLWIALLVLCAYIIEVNWDSDFEIFCFHGLASQTVASRLLYMPIGLVPVGLVCALVKLMLPGNASSKRWIWVDPTTVLSGIVLMWLAFGTLWYLRTELATIAGDGYQDNKWGFGQVAAVAAWFPTLISIGWDSNDKLLGRNESTSGPAAQSPAALSSPTQSITAPPAQSTTPPPAQSTTPPPAQSTTPPPLAAQPSPGIPAQSSPGLPAQQSSPVPSVQQSIPGLPAPSNAYELQRLRGRA